MVTKVLMLSAYMLAQEPYVEVIPQGIMTMEECKGWQKDLALNGKPLLAEVNGRTTVKQVIDCQLVDESVLNDWRRDFEKN